MRQKETPESGIHQTVTFQRMLGQELIKLVGFVVTEILQKPSSRRIAAVQTSRICLSLRGPGRKRHYKSEP